MLREYLYKYVWKFGWNSCYTAAELQNFLKDRLYWCTLYISQLIGLLHAIFSSLWNLFSILIEIDHLASTFPKFACKHLLHAWHHIQCLDEPDSVPIYHFVQRSSLTRIMPTVSMSVELSSIAAQLRKIAFQKTCNSWTATIEQFCQTSGEQARSKEGAREGAAPPLRSCSPPPWAELTLAKM